MKTISILALVLVSSVAQAGVTRDFQLIVEGEKDVSLAKAKISYFDACSNVRAELMASPLAPFVKTTSCTSFSIQEGPTLYRATGGLTVRLKRSMNVESADFATGFVDSEADAHELWNRMCAEWKTQAANPAKVVMETCGQPKLDLFYVKPELTSRAFRVEKVRIQSERGEYCKIRTRFVERKIETPWGWDVIRETLYDLMALVDAGYYEVQGTFTTYEEAQDLLIKSPLCTEEE